jgi:hypothetical protein
MKHHVVATRDGDGWIADVPALLGTHTWAKTLRALDRNVREVIGMVEDLPRSAEAALDLEMDYRTGDAGLDERAGRLRARRHEQERAAAEIASDTSELLRRFAAQLSVGDAAVLLGVSKEGSASCEARRQDSPLLPRAEPARMGRPQRPRS